MFILRAAPPSRAPCLGLTRTSQCLASTLSTDYPFEMRRRWLRVGIFSLLLNTSASESSAAVGSASPAVCPHGCEGGECVKMSMRADKALSSRAHYRHAARACVSARAVNARSKRPLTSVCQWLLTSACLQSWPLTSACHRRAARAHHQQQTLTAVFRV